MFRIKPGVASLATLIGFIALIAAFIYGAIEYSRTIRAWALRDLEARAELASDRLLEPLNTQDFAALHRFADDCRNQGYGLIITSRDGGIYFAGGIYADIDVGRARRLRRADAHDTDTFDAKVPCGEFTLTLSLPVSRIVAPIHRAVPLFLLALLVGVSGMLFVFFALYRQRAKIRELARIEAERRNFIADFSHELKTPLTGIIGSVEMLADAEGDNRQKLLAMIDRESKRLNSLAQRILDLSRLESGRISSLGTREELIALAISNLVENAHRHSGSEEISVREEEKRGFHRWIVEDHGIGVPVEAREKIFERFYRVDPSRAAESGGAGLGLAIVRGIAREFGGDCVCENVEPHGARFIFSVSTQHC